ncbi:MAG: hypothetical protein RIQ33_694 [Bacteroidota bacterium]
MNSVLLQIKNLSIQFSHEHQTVQAVDTISFSINKAEIVGLVGESGSGKSATALAIAQLHLSNCTKYTGEINLFINQTEPTNLLSISENALVKFCGKKIGYIFQDPFTALNPTTKCGNQIVEAILVHQKINFKAAKLQAFDWLQKVGLNNTNEIFNKYPHQLSGGQLQRIVIAMAMCNKPDLLIADEPTTALDASVQASIILLLKQLQAENKMSILFISHDLDLVKQLADKILVMKSGKIVEEICIDKIPTLKSNESHLFKSKNAINLNINNTKKLEYLDTILEVKNVSVNYHSSFNWFTKTIPNNAVSNVSFQLKKTETIGIVGESGSGKTSLAKAILTLIKPANGDIIFNHKSCINLSADDILNFRKQVQYVFQNSKSSLHPRMKIGEAIEEVLQIHHPEKVKNNRKKIALSWLNKVQLDDVFYDRYPHQLSGGQRQRAVIARALATEPTLLIADEPVSNLDISTQIEILNLLKKLQSEFQLSCLFISHDLAIINFMCDKIAVMKDGEIVEFNTTSEILTNPKHNYTKQLIAAASAFKKLNT